MVVIEIGRRETVFFVIVAVLVIVAIGVNAYNSDMNVGTPSEMGHSSGEIHVKNRSGGIVSLQEYIDEGNLKTLLDSPIVLFQGAPGAGGASGNFDATDTGDSVPDYALEVLLFGSIEGSTDPNQYIRYKPGSYVGNGWKFLVYSDGAQYPNSNSVWVPFSSLTYRSIDWEISGTTSGTPNYTLQIYGYR